MARFAPTVALRYMRSRRGFVSVVTGFSLVGIGLGVAALVVVMAVMAGFRVELLDRILGTTGHIQISRPGLTLDEANDLSKKLVLLPGVNRATPYVGGQAMLVGPLRASGGIVRGMAPARLAAQHMVAQHIVAGSLKDFKGNTVILGDTLARNLGVEVGDRINLLSPDGSTTIMGFVPRMMQVKVVGIFKIGMYQYDSGLIFLPIHTALTFFKQGNLVNAIEVMVSRPDRVNSYLPTLQRLSGDSAVLSTWIDNNGQFFNALQVEKTTMFIILLLIVLVAAFNIITGQMMTVNEKGRDIAILRTMGARRVDIMRVFFLSGFLVGAAGTLGGVVLGLLVSYNITPIVHFAEHLTGRNLFSEQVYFLNQLPAQVEPSDVLTITLISLGLAVIASLYPAYRATRLDPVEALRNE